MVGRRVHRPAATDLPSPAALAPEEMRDLLREAARGRGHAEEVADGISAALDARTRFTERHDDIALIVLRCGRPG